HVVDRTHAAPHGERHEDALGGACDHVQDDRALLVRGGDVEEGELVGALGVVAGGRLHRVARVGQVDEAHTLHHAPALHVEAGDDAAGEHQAASATASASARPTGPGSSARPMITPPPPSAATARTCASAPIA